MRTRIMLLFLASAAAGILAAQSPAVVKRVPVSSTSARSGAEMFNNYCASCHGVEGSGNGPAAAALKKAPADLTQLAARNNGKFPDLAVYQAITGDRYSAHGSAEMPVWGEVLKSMDGSSNIMVSLRLANLTEYIKSLQRK
ncbi:MAG TPA: c-type cytochrome [Bryobacteraceae bacterium]|nr:c-type cytochrome [Bryobacteraceae bacterium]